MNASFRVGLLGHGIGPSLTPALHRREAAALELAYRYEIVDLIDQPTADLGAELDLLEREGFDAVNVTHPFKQAVLEHVDQHSDVVSRLGSANLVLLGPRGRTAHNTDYGAFRAALEGFLDGRPRERVVQVGAGGAGRATVCAMLDLGFEHIVVHDREPSAATDMVEWFATPRQRLTTSDGDLDAWLRRADGAVHVTPTGMREHPGVALDVGLLAPPAWVAEVVYRPLATELVGRARSRGLAVLDGGAMAVGQAVESLTLITGRVPDTERMTRHFHELVAAGSAAGTEED